MWVGGRGSAGRATMCVLMNAIKSSVNQIALIRSPSVPTVSTTLFFVRGRRHSYAMRRNASGTRTKHPSSPSALLRRGRDYSTFFTESPFDTLDVPSPSPPSSFALVPASVDPSKRNRERIVEVTLSYLLIVEIRINYIITILMYSTCDNGITASIYFILFFFKIYTLAARESGSSHAPEIRDTNRSLLR